MTQEKEDSETGDTQETKVKVQTRRKQEETETKAGNTELLWKAYFKLWSYITNDTIYERDNNSNFVLITLNTEKEISELAQHYENICAQLYRAETWLL